MSVYVDNARNPYGRMLMCHMIADTTDELHAMARRIEVNPQWIQKAGTYQEHFDICLTKRAHAVWYGAKEISTRELTEKLVARKPTENTDDRRDEQTGRDRAAGNG